MGWARGMQIGSQVMGDILDTYHASKQRKDLAEIADAKPEQSQGFTAEQGEQLRAAGESGQYDIGYDDATKSYTVTPKSDPSQVGTIAQQGVTDFLGNRSAGALTDSQVNSARQRAMAGVVMKHDPISGQRMMRDITQSEQADTMFNLNKNSAERSDRLATQQEADTNLMRQLDQETGDWFSKRLANPDGSQRQATVDDHLAASQFRAAKLVESGKVDAAGQVMKDYNAQALVKIQLDTAQRNEALGRTAAALASGDLGAVKDFYNRFVPDGAHVTDVKQGPKGEIMIQRESADGRPMPAQTLKDTGQLLAALDSFKDPLALYHWSQNEFKNNLALKADKRGDAHLGMAQTAANEAKKEKAEKAEAAVNLYKDQNPNATTAQVEAVRKGIMSAIPDSDKNSPSEVKLAQAMVRAGLAPDMQTGLQMAITKKGQSPDEMHQEFVASGLKNMEPPEAAVKKANEVMSQMGFTKKGGRWSNAGTDSATKPASEKDAHAQAKAAVAGGASPEAVNKRLKEFGFKPL